MDISRTFRLSSIPTPLLSRLDARDAAIWISERFVEEAGAPAVAEVVRLPWRLVLCESSDPTLLEALERQEDTADPLVRRRGFVQLVDTNPAEILLPPRSLPVYLLNGRGQSASRAGLAAITRRLTMLDVLQRTALKELIVAAGGGDALPPELTQLWQEGFRALVTVVSDAASAESEVEAWREQQPSGAGTAYYPVQAITFCQELVAQYQDIQADERVLLRVRTAKGQTSHLDITDLDDPEHPILSNYEILQERDLRPLQAEDLTNDEIQNFFLGESSSWRPYAAGMPWSRQDQAWHQLRGRLRRLDQEGADAGRIAFISSEAGAGATTLLRQLAWSAAAEGYPTLVARSAPFPRLAVEVVTYMSRVIDKHGEMHLASGERLYSAPWLIAFDNMHWEGREDEVRHFLHELQKSGRAACVLMVTGPYLGPHYYDSRRFLQVADLSHQVPLEDALSLGKHLNTFLGRHGPTRSEAEWRNFYAATAVEASRGIAAFWIALSFWVRRQFDLNETIQAWIYRQFKASVIDKDVVQAILDIAALSSERYPLPIALLPPTTDWPVSQKLEDIRRSVPALALAQVSREGDKYWIMVHDLIGRYLLTALFYDHQKLGEFGLEDASNPEHLRFLILRRLAKAPELGHVSNRLIAEEFAVSIFKIDPDQGHATFAPFWRDVLQALDEMPKSLKDTSRSFRHHTAVSRRRIAKQRDYFQTSSEERAILLERAISDIRFALDYISQTADNESDLNLYNSLALAYYDLAEEEIERGSEPKRIAELRRHANEATARAYRIAPDNTFVVETFARSLLSQGREYPDQAVANAVEVLNVVYPAMQRDRSGQRRSSLGRLADKALTLLLEAFPRGLPTKEPKDEIEALVHALHALTEGVDRIEGMELSDFPVPNRIRARELLASPLLQGNPQAVRMRYALLCLDAPQDFRGQLELLQALQDGATVFSPQMRLELALLLHQSDRHHEASRHFRALRQLWSETDHYVEVPERLRWLLGPDGVVRRQVTARITATQDIRLRAKVRELQDAEVPFRSQEFGQTTLRPGVVLRGLISFGHNGPFLRPTTAALN